MTPKLFPTTAHRLFRQTRQAALAQPAGREAAAQRSVVQGSEAKACMRAARSCPLRATAEAQGWQEQEQEPVQEEKPDCCPDLSSLLSWPGSQPMQVPAETLEREAVGQAGLGVPAAILAEAVEEEGGVSSAAEQVVAEPLLDARALPGGKKALSCDPPGCAVPSAVAQVPGDLCHP